MIIDRKNCALCGREFYKNRKYSKSQWEKAMYCCRACALKADNRDPDESIKEKLDKYTIKSDGDKCWSWCGYIDKNGYARVNIKRKQKLAHRISWETRRGKIPQGMIVRHLCDNPVCTNPDHLKLGTLQDNSNDCSNKNRQGRKGAKYCEAFVLLSRHLIKSDTISKKEIIDISGVSKETLRRILKNEGITRFY